MKLTSTAVNCSWLIKWAFGSPLQANIHGPRPTRRGTCVKVGGAGGFPKPLPCVGARGVGGSLWGLWYAFDGCVGAVCVRRRVAYRANVTPNVRRMRAKRVCSAPCRPSQCPTGQPIGNPRHQALPHTPWDVGQVWWTFQVAIATRWSSLLSEYSRITKCTIREFEYSPSFRAVRAHDAQVLGAGAAGQPEPPPELR